MTLRSSRDQWRKTTKPAGLKSVRKIAFTFIMYVSRIESQPSRKLKDYSIWNVSDKPTAHECVAVNIFAIFSNRISLSNSDNKLSNNIRQASFSIYFIKKNKKYIYHGREKRFEKTVYHLERKSYFAMTNYKTADWIESFWCCRGQ